MSNQHSPSSLPFQEHICAKECLCPNLMVESLILPLLYKHQYKYLSPNSYVGCLLPSFASISYLLLHRAPLS